MKKERVRGGRCFDREAGKLGRHAFQDCTNRSRTVEQVADYDEETLVLRFDWSSDCCTCFGEKERGADTKGL